MKKKLTSFFISFMVIAVLVITVYLLNSSSDKEQSDYSDLMPDRPMVADEENAYTYFRKAEESIVFSEGVEDVLQDFIMGKSFATNVIGQFIADNEDAFFAIEDGLKCPVCISPVYKLREPGTHPDISGHCNLIRLLNCKVRYEYMTGDLSNAVKSCVLFMDYAGTRYKYPNSILEYSFGLGAMGSSQGNALMITRDVAVTQLELEVISTRIDNFGDVSDSLVFAAQSEFAMFKEYISTIDTLGDVGTDLPDFMSNWKVPNYFFNHEETIALIADTTSVRLKIE